MIWGQVPAFITCSLGSGEVLFVSSMAAVSSWHKWLSSFPKAWKRGLVLCCRVKAQIFESIRSPSTF